MVSAIQKACKKTRKPSESSKPVELVKTRVCMEDEDELLEYKKTPTTKKATSRISSDLSSPSPRTSVSSDSSRLSGWKVIKKQVNSRASEFTREERVSQLTTAVVKIRENNNLLRDRIR